MKRVVVTGIGAVSPLGNSIGASWISAKSGLSGISPIRRFDASDLRWRIAGELKGFDPEVYLAHKEILRLDPFVHYAIAAAIMAAEDAGFVSVNSTRKIQHSLESAGVIIGSSRGGVSTVDREFEKICTARFMGHTSRISAYLMPATTISMASSYIAQKLGMRGYCLGISNACASGTNAIGEAFRLIRSGYGSPVFCGGAEAPICRICIEGYGAAGALSAIEDSSASRPFDGTRDGFVLSEGACILVLEDYECALKRNARIYGEITGYGNTTDAYHQTVPSPEGEARAIQSALSEACVKPDEIHFVSAHGTSTPIGDRTESKAIKLALGDHACRISVSSLKSMTGHMLAASGSLEAAFTLMGMNEGILLPVKNLKERDPECDLNYVYELGRGEIECAMSLSFGFGGVNAALVFKKTVA